MFISKYKLLVIAVMVSAAVSGLSCSKKSKTESATDNSAGNGTIPGGGGPPVNSPAPITLVFTQPGATYPNNGGNPSTGKLFAQPFQPSANGTVKYAGIGIFSGSQAVKSVSIYSSSGTNCGQSDFGPATCFPNASLISAVPTGTQYVTDVNGTTLPTAFTQVYFGSTGIALTNTATYFLVVEFQNNETMSIGDCTNFLSQAGRRFSIDGVVWSVWDGSSNCTSSPRPSLMFLAQ